MDERALQKEIESVLGEFYKTSVNYNETKDLVTEQGLDSLGLVELISTLEDAFDLSLEVDDLNQLRSPAAVYQTIQSSLHESAKV